MRHPPTTTRRGVNRKAGLPVLSLVLISVILAAAGLVAGCGSGASNESTEPLTVVATTSFLRDITQNVAGDRFTVGQLVPLGAEPHEWDPTPSDLATVNRSDLLIVNGGDLEGPLLKSLANAGGEARIVTASAGLTSRTPKPGEPDYGEPAVADPHWWLNPVDVITYVENIRAAFAAEDPSGAQAYDANAAAYTEKLQALDASIKAQVATIPAESRLLVVNHLSHGYFADRYGFKVVGAVVPSVSSEGSATSQQLADLVRTIQSTGVKAIFVELGENPKLANQIASTAKVKVVTELLDHSLTSTDGKAPTYIAMMEYNTRLIVENLK